MATDTTDVLDAVEELESHIVEEGEDGNEDERDELRQSLIEAAQDFLYSGQEPDELSIHILNGRSDLKPQVKNGQVHMELPEPDGEGGIRYVLTPIPVPDEV